MRNVLPQPDARWRRPLAVVLLAVALAFVGDAIVAGPTEIPSWVPVAIGVFGVCWTPLYMAAWRTAPESS
jgi:protein-S-isoprenylcysteine O-methyltransferase Ste14